MTKTEQKMLSFPTHTHKKKKKKKPNQIKSIMCLNIIV